MITNGKDVQPEMAIVLFLERACQYEISVTRESFFSTRWQLLFDDEFLQASPAIALKFFKITRSYIDTTNPNAH